MASVCDHLAFFGKGLERVAWDEPGCCDLVLFKELEKTTDANCAGKETCLYGCEDMSFSYFDSVLTSADVGRGVFTAI